MCPDESHAEAKSHVIKGLLAIGSAVRVMTHRQISNVWGLLTHQFWD